MKRLSDVDRFSQGIPVNRKMEDLETGRLRTTGVTYVRLEDFVAFQTDLAEAIGQMEVTLVQTLDELQQIKLHLASLSNAVIEPGDGEE